jgi:hypothetical protein
MQTGLLSRGLWVYSQKKTVGYRREIGDIYEEADLFNISSGDTGDRVHTCMG